MMWLSLINFFARKFSKEMNACLPAFSDNVLKMLKKYFWPGNVRALKNLIQRLVLIVDGDTANTSDLPDSMRYNVSTQFAKKQKLDDVIADHILTTLAGVKGNKTQAAKLLGIDRKTLNARLKKIEAVNGETSTENS